MEQPPQSPNIRTSRAGFIDGAKPRWFVAGGGLVGLVAIVVTTTWLFSASSPAAQVATTPTVVAVRHTPLPPTKSYTQVTALRVAATPAPLATSPLPSHPVEARVVRVVDGDTLEIEMAGGVSVVKLVGVSAPGVSPSMCFGREAADYTQAMVNSWGKLVLLESDMSDHDGAGRLLRYVWLEMQGGKRMLNETMLEEGFAKANLSAPDAKYKDRFLTVEHDARIARRGLWGVCGEFGAVSPTQEPTASATAIVASPTQLAIVPTVAPTSTPTHKTSPTNRPSPHPSPTFTRPTSPSPTRTPPVPSPTRIPPPTTVPTRPPTRTARPSVPPASPITATQPTSTMQPVPSQTHLPLPTPDPQPAATNVPTVPVDIPRPTATTALRYDPNGPDRDCPDFDTWEEAQAFFIAAGGPERDPHRLDHDHDGIACENLRKK